MKIEVLGPGCTRCQTTEQNVTEALRQLNFQAEVEKVTEIEAIIARGVMWTPALVIDGKLLLQGKIPTVDQIKQLIKKE